MKLTIVLISLATIAPVYSLLARVWWRRWAKLPMGRGK